MEPIAHLRHEVFKTTCHLSRADSRAVPSAQAEEGFSCHVNAA